MIFDHSQFQMVWREFTAANDPHHDSITSRPEAAFPGIFPPHPMDAGPFGTLCDFEQPYQVFRSLLLLAQPHVLLSSPIFKISTWRSALPLTAAYRRILQLLSAGSSINQSLPTWLTHTGIATMPPNCNICCRFLPTWQRWHRRSLRGRQCPCPHRHDARGAGSGLSLFQLWTSLGFTRCVSRHKPCCECWAMVNITDLLILKFALNPNYAHIFCKGSGPF